MYLFLHRFEQSFCQHSTLVFTVTYVLHGQVLDYIRVACNVHDCVCAYIHTFVKNLLVLACVLRNIFPQ